MERSTTTTLTSDDQAGADADAERVSVGSSCARERASKECGRRRAAAGQQLGSSCAREQASKEWGGDDRDVSRGGLVQTKVVAAWVAHGWITDGRVDGLFAINSQCLLSAACQLSRRARHKIQKRLGLETGMSRVWGQRGVHVCQ